MTIYNLYIFDRHCRCISFTSWTRPTSQKPLPTTSTSSPTSASATAQPDSAEIPDAVTAPGAKGAVGATGMSLGEEAKLVYGVIFSLRNMVNKLVSKPGSEGFISYRTSAYKLHYFETPTGLKFVMNTDPHMESMRDALRMIYAQIYVEYVTKNPLQPFDTPIANDLFRHNLQRYVRSLPGFD